MEEAIKRAVEIAGGAASLARKLGISRVSVHEWVKRGRIPATRVIAVETAVNAEVTRHDLRPDLYPEKAAA